MKSLLKVRSNIQDTILGTIKKAEPKKKDVHALDAGEYLTLRESIEAMSATAYAETIYEEMRVMVEAGWDAAKALLDLTAGFDVPPVWAFDNAQDAADFVASLVTERDKKTLIQVLENAFLEGTSSEDTAEALKTALDGGIAATLEDGTIRTTKADSWFTTVARTELQRAAVEGQVSLYQAAGVQTVRWDVAEPCDLCAEADGEVLPIGENFPGVDVDQPPAHPNCRCVLVPADEDLAALAPKE